MKESLLKSILYEGTLLVKKVSDKKISIQDFVKQYKDFYYYNALDGHEADEFEKTIFSKYSTIIGLHKDIQTTVVDLVYLGDKSSTTQYLDAGRISITQAMERISSISESYQIDNLLYNVHPREGDEE